MSLTKEIIEDKIEVVGEHKAVQVRIATVVKEDGVELTRSYERKRLVPCIKNETWEDTDISGESSQVQGICNAVWTDEIRAAYQTFLDSTEE